MAGVRTFVAIELPADVRDSIAGAGVAVRDCDPDWRTEKWVDERNLHVTLAFMSAVPEAELDTMCETVGVVASRHCSFQLDVDSLQPRPTTRRAAMLWVAFRDPSGACAELARDLGDVLASYGAESTRRAFKAHATLCRARRPRPVSARDIRAAQERLDRGPRSMSVPFVSVFTSRLTPHGPVYTVIDTRRLRGE